MLNKRGGWEDFQWKAIIQLVLMVPVALSIFFLVSDVSNDTTFEQEYTARDLALLMNVIQSSSHDIIVKYDSEILLGKDEVYFNFYENQVSIFELDSVPRRFPFLINKDNLNTRLDFNFVLDDDEKQNIFITNIHSDNIQNNNNNNNNNQFVQENSETYEREVAYSNTYSLIQNSVTGVRENQINDNNNNNEGNNNQNNNDNENIQNNQQETCFNDESPIDINQIQILASPRLTQFANEFVLELSSDGFIVIVNDGSNTIIDGTDLYLVLVDQQDFGIRVNGNNNNLDYYDVGEHQVITRNTEGISIGTDIKMESKNKILACNLKNELSRNTDENIEVFNGMNFVNGDNEMLAIHIQKNGFIESEYLDIINSVKNAINTYKN